jgi:breast cancer 2 susceptibility protein
MEFAAQSKLLEGHSVDLATEDAGKGGLFCTGSGSSVAISERAVKRAKALVDNEGDEATNNTGRSSYT